MSTSPLMMVILLSSSVMCFLMNSWISIWIMLEMNTLAFCCLLKSFSTEKKLMTESSMKYFIIQSVASSLLIFTSSVSDISETLVVMLVVLMSFSLTIKMAAVPFHLWFIEITKKIKWKNATILLTWQKIAPIFLLIYQVKSVIFPFLLMSAMVGSISQMNKVNTMEIMAFSSVFNLSWMITSILMNTKMLLVFSVIYWLSVVFMMIMIHISKMKKINSESTEGPKKWIYLLVITNLAGIPPLAGFMAKWMVFTEGMLMKMYVMLTLLLISSSVNLYIYMRLTNFLLTKNSSKEQKMSNQPKKLLVINMIIMNMFPLSVISV